MKKRFPGRSAFVACSVGARNCSCDYGCVGCGKCVSACKFGAISIGENHVASVDMEKCVGCGACARSCPKGIIHVLFDDNFIKVRCSNKDSGADARKACPSSCVACGMCERICTASAVKVIENIAVIDEQICLSCGMCLVKCPRGVFKDTRGVIVSG